MQNSRPQQHNACKSTTPCLPRMPRSFHQQVAHGDNTAERPMWAEKGGLDFEGRSRWDAWTAVKVRRQWLSDGMATRA